MLRKSQNQEIARRSYFNELVNASRERWESFWLQESKTRPLAYVRILLGLIVAFLAAEGFLTLPAWISSSGVIDASLARALVGVGREWDSLFRPSLLYYVSSPLGVQVYLIGLMLAGLLLAAGCGGRITAAVVYVLFLGICHRMPILTGPGEYLLSAMLLYLVIDTGKLQKLIRPGVSDGGERWTAHVATRLMQVHLWMWILFSLLSQLAAVIWWEGEAVWFLTAAHRSFFSTSLLAGNAYLVNALTHGLILAQVCAVGFLIKPLTRPLGLIAAMVAWLGIALFSGDITYACIGASSSLAFATNRTHPGP
jgi:hypothetical protein